MKNIECLLFDLDGTLADTSLDMCNALNKVLTKNNFKNIDCIGLKTHISRGAVGMIQYASMINQRSIDSSLLRSEFLQAYSENCFIHTKTVDDMDLLIDYMCQKPILWGIVTNKHSKFAKKVVEGLSIDTKMNCLITGDMVSEPKPNPEGLLEASKIVGVDASKCVYVGDDERDILAGKNAGMYTIAADFGFIDEDQSVETWNADEIIKKPTDLISLL